MPSSLINYKENHIWVSDNHLEIILFFGDQFLDPQKKGYSWLKDLKEDIPLYLKGFVPGGIDLRLKENLTNKKRIKDFTEVLERTKKAIEQHGPSLDIDLLNEIESQKGEDAIPWKEPLATKDIIEIIDNVIQVIENKPLVKKEQIITLGKKLSVELLKLDKHFIFSGKQDANAFVSVPLSKLGEQFEDISFKLSELNDKKLKELKDKLSPTDFDQLIKASEITVKPLGKIILYKTKKKQTAYYHITETATDKVLLCLGYGEYQPMRWTITLESIHLLN